MLAIMFFYVIWNSFCKSIKNFSICVHQGDQSITYCSFCCVLTLFENQKKTCFMKSLEAFFSSTFHVIIWEVLVLVLLWWFGIEFCHESIWSWTSLGKWFFLIAVSISFLVIDLLKLCILFWFNFSSSYTSKCSSISFRFFSV